jgi:hypothetical protein
VERFLSRMRPAHTSTLTLAGTGPNGSSQLQILKKIGRENIRLMSQVNVISGSSVSYFIYIAMLEGGFKADGFKDYDKLVRKLHKGSVTRLLIHLLTRRHKAKPVFENQLLEDTLRIFFEREFITRTLSTFDENIRFYAYCQTQERIIELSANTHPKMTVGDVFRACVSISFLHGAFCYESYQFVDPTFSKGFGSLRRQLLATEQNHLFVNIKKHAESRNVIFVKNEDLKFPILRMFLDFSFLCMGIPNGKVKRVHSAHLEDFHKS